MQATTRALIAASAFAAVTGNKVAGLYDHTAAEHLRIASERRGDRVKAVDGEHSLSLGGTLPDLYHEADRAFVSLVVDGSKASGYDATSHGHYVAEVTGRVIQLYDYTQSAWFAYEAQVVEPGPV